MNLFDMLAQGQGNNGLQSLGQQFGLSQQQTQAAVEALLPAFSKGLQQTASTPQGLGALLTMLSGGQSLSGSDAGNGVLGQLFGSKDLSRAVAAQASQATGVSQDVLKQMLPAIATMLMGGMAKQTNQQIQAGTFAASNPLGQIIEQMMKGQGGQAQSNNPLGDILGQILGGGQQPQQRAPQGSNNPLGDILGQILKGGGAGQPQQRAPQGGNNPLGDILGQILGGGQQSQPQPRAPQGGSGSNPIGDILEQILRQNGGGQAVPQPDEQPAPQPQRRAQPRQQPQSSNPLEDILGKMFNPGNQQQLPQAEDYQRSVDNIFEQFRRGVDRQTGRR
jgi:hypothetical protein